MIKKYHSETSLKKLWSLSNWRFNVDSKVASLQANFRILPITS